VANDYSTSTDAFSDISEGNYSSSDYPQMAAFVTVASRMIDAELGRWAGFFYPTTDAADFYYDGSGECNQPIDEFVSVSAVAVAEQGGFASTDYTAWTLNTDYITAPYNASAKGKPITCLELVTYNGTKGAWYSGQKAIKVTGIPGYSATPPELIATACRVQAVRWFMRAKQGWQDIGGNENIGEKRYKGATELDGDVKAMLYPFKLELSQ
jgi:hypothetical protein